MSDKIFFNPGDTVQLKHAIDNKPKRMLVHAVDMTHKVDDNKKQLLGITCIWFTTSGELQKCRFNSKDLKHI